jgi:hypothetical protein
VSIRQIDAVGVEHLYLDSQNPRLPRDLQLADQQALIDYFDERYELDEISESMIDKGFFAQEPLLALEPDANGEHIVIEGNRRLATLKLLTQPTCAAATPRATHWLDAAKRAAESGADLDPVPVMLYRRREELEDYLGFRHVTGIAGWSAEAKARFVAGLICDGRSFKDAARAIGSRQDAVRRQFVTWSALEQARAADQPVDRATKFFGTFYRALQNKGIREYAGLPDPREIQPADTEPIPVGDEPKLATLVDWLFGDGGRSKPLFTDSRRLNDLGRILQVPDARNMLEEERDFKLALELAGNDRSTIESSLIRARSELLKANSVAFDFVGDPEVLQRAQAVERVLETVISTLGTSASSPTEGASS